MKYLISYDLNTPGQHYDQLVEAINSYSSCTYINRSTWAVESEKTAGQIRDHLKLYIDSNDNLFVCGINTWAANGLLRRALKWLND